MKSPCLIIVASSSAGAVADSPEVVSAKKGFSSAVV